MNDTSTIDLQHRFRARFGTDGTVFRAPGRVNLIGEHTDYNEGFVLPAAIDLACRVVAAPRDDDRLVIHSESVGATFTARLGDAARSRQWSDYPLGVAWSLQRDGYALRGADLLIDSNVPIGAGLSSSAAIEVAVGYALLDVAGHAVDRKRLALACQFAENEFVGARCGIMDQYVSCHGAAGSAVLLDCRALTHRIVRLPDGVEMVICNTMVKHEISTGGYNTRRAECEEGVRKLAAALPDIRSLRDVTRDDLERHRDLLTPLIYRRCRHIVTENARVHRLAAALEARDRAAIGALMAESHRSMRDDFEISCPELDVMVDLATRDGNPHVLGARMTGGGFGGSAVVLVDEAHADALRQHLGPAYQAATGIAAEIRACHAADGAGRES